MDNERPCYQHTHDCDEAATFQVEFVDKHTADYCTTHFVQFLNWELMNGEAQRWFAVETISDKEPHLDYLDAIRESL